jgi:hypothetical protein
MTTTFKPGDIVCHKATFLRSIAWYTNVPINGRVEAVDGNILTVHWNDQENPTRILAANVILFSERHLEPR